MTHYLRWKLYDLGRCFRAAEFDAVAHHYNADYAERMDVFAGGRCSQSELDALLRVRPIVADERVLDFGCNTGRLGDAVRVKTGAAVVGVDRNAAAIERARKQFPALEFHLYDGDLLPFTTARFDHIMVNHVIGHVADPDATLGELVRSLTDGGTLSVVTPNRWYKCGMTPLNLVNRYQPDPTVLRYYTRGSLARLLERHGLEVEQSLTTGEPCFPFRNQRGPDAVRMRVFMLARKRPS